MGREISLSGAVAARPYNKGVGARRNLYLAGGAFLALVSVGCAHGEGARDAQAAGTSLFSDERLAAPSSEPEFAPPAVLPAVDPPVDHPTARRALELGFGALEMGQYALAAAHFRAVLLTDYLTDAGRMNIYWFTAEAHARLDDQFGERDALEGFLLAAEQAPVQNEDVLARTLHARSVLASIKLAELPEFGRSPELPIVVEDPREPESIVASLACGPNGENRFVEVDEEAVLLEHSRLVHRRVTCHGSSLTIDLWFDVTHMENAPISSAFDPRR